MQDRKRVAWSFGFAAILTILTLSAACVLMPRAEFERQVERDSIGKSFSQWTTGWAPPLSVETTTRGTRIYAFHFWAKYPKRDCILFVEVADDTIIAATHKGKTCFLNN